MFLRIAASSAKAAGASEQGEDQGGEAREDRFMAVFQESSARAVSQRLSGATRLTRDIPLLRSSRIGADGSANKRSKPSVMRVIAQVGAARCRTYRRSNRSSPTPRHGSRPATTAASAATSARPRLRPCPASG